MREIRLLVAYFAVVLFFGSLIAPWVYWCGQALGEAFSSEMLLNTSFQRYFNRAFLIAALLFLWPLLVLLRIQGLKDLHLQPNPRRWHDLGAGFFFAAFSLVPLWFALFQFGIYEFKREPFHWAPLYKAVTTAGTVAVLEECFFRAGLMGLILRNAKPSVALWFVASLFSIVHWIKPPDHSPVEVVEWTSGFLLLPHCFWRFANLPLLLGGFLTLLAVGLILGHARLATGSIWLSIGLHAGWVFGIRSFARYVERVQKDTLPWLGSDLLIGVWPLCVVLGTGAVVLIYLKSRNPEVVTR